MSWIQTYMKATAKDNTSELFKTWAAIYTLGAAVGRRVYSMSMGEPVYPNLYLLLVGPSAAGKGLALGPIEKILAEQPPGKVYIAPASITSAALADELEDARIEYVDTKLNKYYKYNGLCVVSREFGVFLPEYSNQMLNTLTDLYDNKGYDERRRGRGKRQTMPEATLSLIGGCTPSYLNNVLPEVAWEQGFMSRTIVIYAGPQPPLPIVETPDQKTSYTDAAKMLHRLMARIGRVHWTREALDFYNNWYTSGQLPKPTHPKLITYNNRRPWNLMKLSLIYALSDEAEKIQPEHVTAALELLCKTEDVMPDAFKAMKTGGDQQAIKDLLHYIESYNMRRGEPMPKSKVIKFLSERVPIHSVEKIEAIMVQSKIIRLSAGGYTATRETT